MDTTLRKSGYLFASVFALGIVFNVIQVLLRGLGPERALFNLTQLTLLVLVVAFLVSTLGPGLRWIQPLVFLAAFPLTVFPVPDRIYPLGFFLTGALLLERGGFFLRSRLRKTLLLVTYLLAVEVAAIVLGKGPAQDAAGATFFVVAFGLFLWFLYRDRLVVLLKEPKPRLSLEELGLSRAERSYAMALLEGRSPKEIGADYDVSESTVRNTVARVYRKVGVEDATAFAVLAATHDIVS